MFTEQDLNELVAFRSDESPVLSLFLNVDPTQQTTDQYRLTLRTMLKGIAGDADRLSTGDILVLHSAVPVDAGQPLPMFSDLQEIDSASGEQIWGLAGPEGYLIYRCIADSRLPGEVM